MIQGMHIHPSGLLRSSQISNKVGDRSEVWAKALLRLADRVWGLSLIAICEKPC
jgi:hypothetical protein